jgi:hypothetical protein
MSKGEKRRGLDATVGGLRKIVQPYRKSVLVIDGKNTIDDEFPK